MPLRGLKHCVPYSRQAPSVYGMIKFLLENSAGSADSVSCTSSFSDLRQAKKAVFRLPGGGGGREVALCHSIRQLHARRPDVISVWGSRLLRNHSDLLLASCLLFLSLLPYRLTQCSLVIASQTSSSLRWGISTAHQMGCLASSGNGQDRELLLGSGGSLPAQSRVSTRGAEGASPGCTQAKGDRKLPKPARADTSFQP